MDNKYGLGSDKVSAEIHDRHQKASSCFKCQAIHLQYCPDHGRSSVRRLW
jgi:hypothetical protein